MFGIHFLMMLVVSTFVERFVLYRLGVIPGNSGLVHKMSYSLCGRVGSGR
jgi:hypothetical protein